MALWNKSNAAPASRAAAVPAAEQYLRGFTETTEIAGFISGKLRMLDVLNQSAPIRIERAHVMPLEAIAAGDGPEAREEKTVEIDPLEFELILAGPIDPSAHAERLQKRVRKLTFPVRVGAGQWVVEGMMHLLPGSPPEAVLVRGGLFVPVTGPHVFLDGRLVAAGNFEVALINRHSIKELVQISQGSLA